jgi:CBS domain containing-hemolysin-like protein
VVVFPVDVGGGLLGGEMIPKILGVHHAERLAPHLLLPLTWMLRICHPIVNLLERLCERLKSRTSDASRPSDTIMDIITLVQAARAEQVLHNREEIIIIIHAATLGSRRVKSVMVPREAVRSFNKSLSLHENVQRAGPKLHRSYPVDGAGDLDDIEGYIRVRELFVQNLNYVDARWRDLVRPVLRVHGDATLTHLLALFLERNEIAALVEDGPGRVVGWVTLDDVTETLMGSRN